jgi:hypothetical protein
MYGGGPSIVLHRYHERDVTTIRPRDYEESKACKKIFGYDANALNLWSTVVCAGSDDNHVHANNIPGIRTVLVSLT